MLLSSLKAPGATHAVQQPRSSGCLLPRLPPRRIGDTLRGPTLLRPGQLVVLREAATTELLEAPAKAEAKATEAGHSNGSANGLTSSTSNGNGKAVPLPPTVVPSSVAAQHAASSTNGNGKQVVPAPASAAVTAPAAAVLSSTKPTPSDATHDGAAKPAPAQSLSSLDVAMDPKVAGQVETVAITTPEPDAPAQKKQKLTAAGTPYKNPGGKWSQFRSYSVFQRTTEIWTFAVAFAWRYFMLGQKWTYGKTGMTPEAVSARKKELAIWLREGLVKLGPTFIKIGQQFSTRVDVLSPEFVKELEKLQDNVPPFDNNAARQILETSMGKKVDEVFSEFAPEPIAAASLGQVYIARLKSGEKVVVKVQRPGLKELFDIDLKNIRALAVWLQKVDPKTDGAARDWVAIYDECSRILYQEIDYRLEGKNADMFRENFKDLPWVKVPKVYWEHSTSEVLVLEYTPGVKINDAAAIDRLGLDRNRLARLSVECYLQQILRHGFFHADPHPGNVAVDTGAEGGRLIYYDFGMMGSISPDVKSGLLELFYGVYQRDPDRCLEALVTMGVYQPSGDKVAVRRTAEFFLKTFADRLDEQRRERDTKGSDYNKTYKPQRSKDEAKARRKLILTSIGEDLLVAANDQPFRFPAAFTFVVRSFTVLDGIGKSLDPRFDISEIAAPYARELLLEGNPVTAKFTRELKKGIMNQNRAVVNLFKGPNQIEQVADTLQRMERGDLKLRVRALEAERALVRVQAWQRVIFAALAASALLNIGTVLSVSALSTGATASFVGATFFAFQTLKAYLTVSKLEKKEAQITGAAA